MIIRVEDITAEIFEAPFGADSCGAAIRSFEDACRNQETKYGKWPEDFVLWQVGHCDNTSGTIAAMVPNIRLCRGQKVGQEPTAAQAADISRLAAVTTSNK